MSKGKLLILDDESMTGNTIKTIAEFSGFECRFTPSPVQFFEWVAEWSPDLIAIDLIMPQMDGVEVIVELAKRHCMAGIIVTSGVGSRILDAAGRSAKEHGLNILGVLPKPFTPAALRELLSFPLINTHLGGAAKKIPNYSDELTPKDLKIALEQQQLVLAYQPKVECTSGKLYGFEALARWHHPTRGIISPDEFIPLAEKHGLIDLLTEYVTKRALHWLSGLTLVAKNPSYQHQLERLQQEISLSINISARSLTNLPLFERLNSFCEEMGVPAQRLIFELTETTAMDDPVLSLELLTRLRLKGFRLSIDDFGTGYSSMLQLVRLPFSEIKVDKSFVMTLTASQESRTVIKSIVDLGKSLGLQTIAEGIEEEEALTYLRELGCSLAQGYFIAKPLAEENVVNWIISYAEKLEKKRLDALHKLDILDTPKEDRFDRLTRLSKRLFDVPISFISLIDCQRQWFKSTQGIETNETSREISFCSRAIEGEEVYIIPDTRESVIFANNPLVTGSPGIQFYAGAIIRNMDGQKIGTLCIADTKPRNMSKVDIKLLEDLALMAERELISEKLINLDYLTGLLNRQAFESRAKDVLNIAWHQKLSVSLLFFDINNFKTINDNYGHMEGDNALVDFSLCLAESCRESDLIARFGGDEFIVLLLDTNSHSVLKMIQRFTEGLREKSQKNKFEITFSVGVSTQRDDNQPLDLNSLIEEADQDMYIQKAKGPLLQKKP